MENFQELVFMVFGLGFFVFVIRMVTRDQREDHATRIMEAREFGFGGKNQHTARTLHKPK